MAQLRKRDLFKVFLRSFYIQSTWNSERLLGLGFGFCLIPIARRLFNDKKELIDFLRRHLDFFNSHPYMATFALGSIANIEEQAMTKNWQDKRPICIFKSRIIGPLGAIGDSFFWQLIRPALGLLGIVLLWLIGIWGVAVYLILYNSIHLFVRIKGLMDSYLKGFDIVRDLSLRGTQKYFRLIKYACSSLLAIGVVYIIGKIYHSTSSWQVLLVFMLALFVSFSLVRRGKINIDLLIVIVICSSIILGLII